MRLERTSARAGPDPEPRPREASATAERIAEWQRPCMVRILSCDVLHMWLGQATAPGLSRPPLTIAMPREKFQIEPAREPNHIQTLVFKLASLPIRQPEQVADGVEQRMG